MSEDTYRLKPIQSNHGKESLDLKRILKLIVRRWYLFPAFMIFTMACAFLYNRYATPIFLSTATILIEEEGENAVPGSDQILEGIGLRASMRNLDNQIYILRSRSLIEETLEELPFDIDYYRKGRFMTASYYPLHPVVILADTSGDLPYGIEFYVTYETVSQYRLRTEKNDFLELDTVMVFGQKLEMNNFSFSVVPDQNYEEIIKSDGAIYFKFNRRRFIIGNFRSRLRVEPVSRDATIILLSLEGSNRLKDTDFLNKLMELYGIRNLDKKNAESERIIDFIDEQLVGVSDSLMIAEDRLERFRSRNRVMDISAQGQQIIEQAVRLEDEKARLMLEASYFDYLTEYLAIDSSTQETIIAPASMGIQEPMLTSLVQTLLDLQRQYFSGSVGERNPIQAQLSIQMENVKETLRETLQGAVLANQMAIEENTAQIRNLNTRAANLPETERQLLGIQREFEINNVLYTYLLTTRSEAQIQKASNSPDNEIIDIALPAEWPIAPKRMFIYIIAFLLGVLIPFGSIMAGDVFNNKISSEEELKSMTRIPIAGLIPASKPEKKTIVLSDPSSIVAESFRSLRSRMQFLIKETKSPVILVTSSIPGEGKTFTALNLASIYSLIDKKTILLGFDLRRPTLHEEFQLKNNKGLSTYLIGKDELKDITTETKQKNLHIILAGPVPPNSAELIASDKTKKLIRELKNTYDIIVIDSAPIGSISDTDALVTEADICLLVARQGKTIKQALSRTIEDVQDVEPHKLGLVFNGIKQQQIRYGYYNRYGYGVSVAK